jgi:hypothetical protein
MFVRIGTWNRMELESKEMLCGKPAIYTDKRKPIRSFYIRTRAVR